MVNRYIGVFFIGVFLYDVPVLHDSLARLTVISKQELGG